MPIFQANKCNLPFRKRALSALRARPTRMVNLFSMDVIQSDGRQLASNWRCGEQQRESVYFAMAWSPIDGVTFDALGPPQQALSARCRISPSFVGISLNCSPLRNRVGP